MHSHRLAPIVQCICATPYPYAKVRCFSKTHSIPMAHTKSTPSVVDLALEQVQNDLLWYKWDHTTYQSTKLPVLKQKDFVFVQSLHTLHLSSLVNLVLLVHAGFGSRATGTVARPGHLDVLAALIAAVFGRHPGLKEPSATWRRWPWFMIHDSLFMIHDDDDDDDDDDDSWFMIHDSWFMMMMMMTTKMKMMMMNKNLVMGVVDDDYHHDAGENDDDEEDENTDNDDNDPHDDVDCTEGNLVWLCRWLVLVGIFKSKHHGVGFVHCQFDLWDLPHGGVHMEPHGDFWLPYGPCLLIVLPSILAPWHPHCSLLSLRYSQWGSVSPWPGKGWKGKEVFTWGY